MMKSQLRESTAYRAWRVLSEGFVAGLVAAFTVMAVFFAHDVAVTEPFHTPSILHAYFWEGAEAAAATSSNPDRAFAYAGLHLLFWAVAGIVASVALAVAESSRRSWYRIAFGATAALVCLILLAPPWQIPGIGSHHIWVGACAGGVGLALYFGRGHSLVAPPPSD